MSPKPSSVSQQERRLTRRRKILDAFSVFVVIPRKGVHRLGVLDVSDSGIGFDLDVEGESAADFPLDKNETLEIHFYLNQSLFLPLILQVMRIEGRGSIRSVGGELKERTSKSFKAYKAFLEMLEHLSEAGQVSSGE